MLWQNLYILHRGMKHFDIFLEILSIHPKICHTINLGLLFIMPQAELNIIIIVWLGPGGWVFIHSLFHKIF